MERKSTRHYMLLSLSISAGILAATLVAVYFIPKSIYILPPISIVIGYIKPIGAKISFRNVLASFVYLIIGSFFAYLVAEGNDAARGTLISLFMTLLYFESIKGRGARS